MLINYTINADFLYNFYNADNFQVGAFAGLGLGGISSLQTYELLFHSSITAFDVGLNMGLRANVFDNHSVEFAVYVPFLPYNEAKSAYIRQIYHHAFSMMARYVYSFDFTKKQAKQAIKRDNKYKNRRIQTQQNPKNIKQPNNDNYDEYDVYYK